MQHAKLKYVLFILLTFLTLGGRAESVREDSLQGDAVDTLDIRVEVLVASEGEVVYSAMGHTALRIACPTLGMGDGVWHEERSHVRHPNQSVHSRQSIAGPWREILQIKPSQCGSLSPVDADG